MSTPNDTLDRLRQPEYTGENRCLPCTLVNSVIAVVLAAGIGFLWLPAGVLALVASFGAIYFRGYLVPGTPELTQRYFPEWLLELFGKDPIEAELRAANDQPETAVEDGGNDHSGPTGTEELLLTAGVVVECDDVDDLCLTDEFSEVWWRRIRRFRSDSERAAAQLGAVVDVDPDALDFVEAEDGNFAVTLEGDIIARWSSDAAFYADLAAEPTLSEWLPDWEGLTDRQRTDLLAGMRAFLETCPACDADLEPVEDVRKSCCSGEVVSVSVDCTDCGALVFSGSYR
ncbi:MAG: hypothetical protein V5A55_01550 [Halovenus sp.]